MPAIMQLQGPSQAALGCVGCTRATTQPSASPALSGAVGGILAASPFTMFFGLAFGAFLAWNYTLKPHKGTSKPPLQGHRRRRR